MTTGMNAKDLRHFSRYIYLTDISTSTETTLLIGATTGS